MKNELAQYPQPTYVKPRYRRFRRRKRFSFDLHGVVDANSQMFRPFLKSLIVSGWEVHIVTGAPWHKEAKTLKRKRIPFTHFFSIVDHHVAIGTKIRWDKKGNA